MSPAKKRAAQQARATDQDGRLACPPRNATKGQNAGKRQRRSIPNRRLAYFAHRVKSYASRDAAADGLPEWITRADSHVDAALAEIIEAGAIVEDTAIQTELHAILGGLIEKLIEVCNRFPKGP